jgi:hypothetical protein
MRFLSATHPKVRARPEASVAAAEKMRNDIYAPWSTPVGFHDDTVIYDLDGRAVGELRGLRVYCMARHYVGTKRP